MAEAQAGLSNRQLGIGRAEQDLARSALGIGAARTGLAADLQRLGGFEAGLGQTGQALRQRDIATLGQVGTAQQAQAQALIEAARQTAKAEELEPLERLRTLQSGVASLISGYPQQETFRTTPDPSPLATALGLGATGAGIYRAIVGPNR